MVCLAVFAMLQISSVAAFAKLPEPTNSYYVYDEPLVLSLATEEHIVSVNEKLNVLCGAQIVIACVNTTGDEDIADYTYRLFNKWKIGSEEENNGVLVVMSILEDDYYALQGKGLEDLLSSGTLKLMLDESLEPYFARGDYDGGAMAIFDSLADFIEQIYSLTPDQIAYAVVPSSTLTVPGTAEYTPQTDDELFEDFSLFGIIGQFVRAIIAVIRFVLTSVVVIVVLQLLKRRRRGYGGFVAAGARPVNCNPYSAAGRTSFYGGTSWAAGGARPGAGYPHNGSYSSNGAGRRGSFSGGFHAGTTHQGGGGMSRGGGAGRI